MVRRNLAGLLVVLLATGCSTVAPAPKDAGGSDGGGITDAGTDAGVTDAGVTDAGTDAGVTDAGTDAGVTDAGTDAGMTDAGTDAGVTDAGMTDAGTDAGMTDAGTDAGTPDAGVTDAGVTDAGTPDAGIPDGGVTTPASSVLEHHNDPARDGVYVAPNLTEAVAATVHLDAAFQATVQGDVRAQPLYLTARAGTGGPDLLLVGTEQNMVYGLNAVTGAVVWSKSLGTPTPGGQGGDLPCGNINPLGITGTPVVDPATRTLYVDGMIDVSHTPHHRVFALDADTGAVKSGWPVDVDSAVSGFNSYVQNQRGALGLMNGVLYVPYGGHYGDCGNYHGWLVGISTTNPTQVQAWATPARGGGMWAVGGVASDGTHLWTATGNTFNATTWSGGEAVIRFGPGPTFSGTAADYFAPSNWAQLDSGDVDIGGSGPVLFDAPGSTPAKLTIALGKNGHAYLLDRDALGGIGGQLDEKTVASNEIIQAATAYHTAQGTYVAFLGNGVGCPAGQSGSLTALKIVTGAPPTLSVAWCANAGGRGSPIFTTTGSGADPIVWVVGAEGDERLHGYDADTGSVVFGGGGATDVMGPVGRFQTPIVAGGRIYVGGNGAVYAFRP